MLDAVYAYNEALMRMAVELRLEDFMSSYGRLHEKALRVAALLASFEGHENIHLPHWARAQTVTEEWRLSLHRLSEQINEGDISPETDLEDRILKLVERLGNPTASEMSAYIRNRATAQIGRAADEMVEMGLLQATGKPYGDRIIKRYSLPSDNGKAG